MKKEYRDIIVQNIESNIYTHKHCILQILLFMDPFLD